MIKGCLNEAPWSFNQYLLFVSAAVSKMGIPRKCCLNKQVCGDPTSVCTDRHLGTHIWSLLNNMSSVYWCPRWGGRGDLLIQ